MTLWLDPIPPVLRDMAISDFAARDAGGFLSKASNEHGLDLVMRNMAALKEQAMYEHALLIAFIGTRTNNKMWPLDWLRYLFELADRSRLLAAGDPLPEGDYFTIYRGVAGRGPARRVKGLSWTADKDRAEWFADRAARWQLHDPAVYTATVSRADVWAYVNEREEEEFIVLLSPDAKVRRIGSREPAKAPGP